MRFAVLLLTVAGCSTIEPEVVRIEAQHESHLTQHPPFDNPPTVYGMNQLALATEWRQGRWNEHVSLGYAYHGLDGCESCPRELFQMTIGFDLWRKR